MTLSWEPSSDTNAAGYNVYYGSATHSYTNMVDAGNVDVARIGGLVEGTTYYFAATAYLAQGQESGLSNEATYTVPVAVTTNNLATVQIQSAPAGQLLLTLTGSVSQMYSVEATPDLIAWSVIGTATVGASGSVNFTDTNSENFTHRFYRACQTP